jgi:hypothetical protein
VLADERQRLADREAERLAEEREASERRMAAEADGYERPGRYSPVPDSRIVLTQRQRLELQAKREAEEQERQDAERPLIESERRAAEERDAAEAEEHELQEKRRVYEAEWVKSDPDPKLFVTPSLVTASMSEADAATHNTAEVNRFLTSTPDFADYKTPQNADKLLAYFERNGVRIYDAAMLRAAFVRLRDLGLLTKKPTPQPTPVERPTYVNLDFSAPAPEEPSGPKTYTGRDYATGLQREFTEREVNRMGSLAYQRAFEIAPTVAELFTRMSESR